MRLTELMEVLAQSLPRRSAGSAQLRKILEEWRSWGWLEQGDQMFSLKTGDPKANARGHRIAPVEVDQSQQSPIWSGAIRLSSNTVRVDVLKCPSGAVHGKALRLVHLLSGLPSAETNSPGTTLVFSFLDEGFSVQAPHGSFVFARFQDATSCFIGALVKYSYTDVSAHTTLHASAATRLSSAVIFPAQSGHGKSTLTGFLAAHGWDYAGDDVIGIGRDPAQPGKTVLLPFPTALGVKEGSAGVLSLYYPELKSVPSWTYGRKAIRYLGIDLQRTTRTPPYRAVRTLVFPRYHELFALDLKPISAWAALRTLLEAGTGDVFGLDEEKFGLLVDLARGVPCFELRYSNLEDARSALETLP